MPTFLERIKARKFSSVSSTAVDLGVSGETQARLSIDAGGAITWSNGALSGDTNLYRDAANVLKTDDALKVSALYVNSIEIDTTGAQNNYYLVYNGTKFVPTEHAGGTSIYDENTIDGGVVVKLINAEITDDDTSDTVDGGGV